MGSSRWGCRGRCYPPFVSLLMLATWDPLSPSGAHSLVQPSAHLPLLRMLPSPSQGLSESQNVPKSSPTLNPCTRPGEIPCSHALPCPPLVSYSTVEEDNDSGGFDVLDFDGRCLAELTGIPVWRPPAIQREHGQAIHARTLQLRREPCAS